MGPTPERRFTADEYQRATRIINAATGIEPSTTTPTGTDVGEAIARIQLAEDRLKADMHFTLADVQLALAVHTSLTPPREDYEEPDRVLDWLRTQESFAVERVQQPVQSLVPTRTPLKDSLTRFSGLAWQTIKRTGGELFPAGDSSWNLTRREIAGIVGGTAIAILLATNVQLFVDSQSRTMVMLGQRCEPVVQLLIDSGANTSSTPKEELSRQCADIVFRERYLEEFPSTDPEWWFRAGYVLILLSGVGLAGSSTVSLYTRVLNGVNPLRRIAAAK